MRTPLLALLAACALPAWAQHAHSPYAGMQDRDIKALSAEQVADLREGRGMGASLPAELNGAPGPMHVLQLREPLALTPQQSAELERITSGMKAAAQQLGAQVIEAERELDRAFRGGTADEAGVRRMSERIGTLNGQLRAVHLVAHLKTRQLLTEKQVAAYDAQRGYSAAPAGGGHVHRH